MRPYLIILILIFLLGTVFARYHEKTRFDRSVQDEREVKNTENDNSKWSLTDNVTHFIAYKSKKENDCYLENIKQNQNVSSKKWQFKVLYALTILTKLKAWQLAGGRIVNFCNGRTIILVQTTKPVPGQSFPFLNETPLDENDISSTRIADMILKPLIARTRRQIQFEQREKINIEDNFSQIRQRRQTNQFRGKFRGQTQSQYLNAGSGEQKEGKAEAEATQQSSRAIVSGNRGMGQAQSMSSGGTGCEDCIGYPGYSGADGIPHRLHIPSTDGRYVQGLLNGVRTPGITRPGIGVISPGGIVPSGQATYPGGAIPGEITTHPGILPGIKPGIYPASVQPGSMIPGRDGTYPGTIIPTGNITYPVPTGIQFGTISPGTVTPERWPDGIRTGDGTIRPVYGATYPGGVHPGVVRPEGIRPGTVIPGGGPTLYPGGAQPSGIPSGGIPPTTGVGTYPGSVQPGIQPGQATYPLGGVTLGATADTRTYLGGIAPGTGLPSGIYPGGSATVPTGTGGTYPGIGIHPDNIRSGITPTSSTGIYPGGVVPGGITSQEIYPGGRQHIGIGYPGGAAPGTLPDRSTGYPTSSRGQVPGVVTTTGSIAGTGTQIITYPSGQPTDGQAIYQGPGTVVQPGTIPGSGVAPGGQPSVVYPGGTTQTTHPLPGILYPSQGIYPGRGDQILGYLPGPYAGGIEIPRTSVPGGVAIPDGMQYPIGTMGGETIGRTGIIGQYPGQYPGADSSQGVGKTVGMVDDNAESQASSSVQQADAGTQASASAQGKYGQSKTQSQVTGTYSGSGTFSAQAGTSDINKSAQVEISGGKEGAISNAQSVAGYGKSQAQVQLDPDSGATSTGAQSSGWNHGTNSQVEASSKGGMADAQANGEGSTSSQAQIGFQPYLKKDEKVEKHTTPFRGSGTASAQSGTHSGQSQSQLQGSFQYGITYTGAAQAGSGSGAASSRKPFNFNFTNTEFFKPLKPQDPSRRPINVDSTQSDPPNLSLDYDNRQDNREQILQSSSTSKKTVVVSTKDNPKEIADRKVLATEKPRTDDMLYDEYDDEYADEYYDTTMTSSGPRTVARHHKLEKTAQQQNHQTQITQVAKGNQFDVHISQDSNVPRTGDILQPGQNLSGYTIPPGFRGKVVSISGTETIAQGDGKSQSQTVSLVPKNFNNTKSFTETRSLQNNYERNVDRYISNSKNQARSFVNQDTFSNKHIRLTPTSIPMKPSYYTVTNSVAGKINGSNVSRKYEHRYYTKSSTCGYFTFSCNVVYGSNGRTKICKPKVPTYPDGTPMKC